MKTDDNSTASALAETPTAALPRSTKSVVDLAVSFCRSDGIPPSRAAVKAMDFGPVSQDALFTLATIGVASLVNDRIHTMRDANRRPERESDGTPKEALVTQATRGSTPSERRAALYVRVTKALLSIYEAADGSMKSLVDFSADDHEHRLSAARNERDGAVRLVTFHVAAIKRLRASGAATIGGLPKNEQKRLAGLLS